jgi:sulfate adenylyltransferase large subunit/thioredoxin-dependent adenylylsulfate APS reductase
MNTVPQIIAANAAKARPLIRIVIVGHVDHGKSTLIGRLLHETGSLPDGKLEALKEVSARRGMPFEWSFLLDALQTERDQGITIDTSQIRFRTPSRDFVLIDAPGHAEFLRNMITGAAQADAAILIVDATEGVRDQTRRHGYLLHLLGVRQVAVVINKMDRVSYDVARFNEIETEILSYLAGLGLTPTAVIPVSARNGDGVAHRTEATAWHAGPTVLEALDQFSPARAVPDLPLRLPVQAVYKFDDRRIIAGRVESGRIAVGDQIVVQPSGKTARVKSIESWPAGDPSRGPHECSAGESVGITLDQELFVSRGHVISAISTPASTGSVLRARVFWLHSAALQTDTHLIVRIGTAESRGVVTAIDNAVDPGRLLSTRSQSVGQNHVGEVEITLSQPLATDIYSANPATGRVALEFDGRIAGGGLVLAIEAKATGVPQARPEQKQKSAAAVEALTARLKEAVAPLTPAERILRLRHDVSGPIVFTTSFGLEDQVILHLVRKHGIDVDIVTLDTGRLFPETYNLWADTERRYGCRIRAIYPRHADLEALVDRHGINGFYESRDVRTACCEVRKVEPLTRALAGAEAWITGLRGNQSVYREGMGIVTLDADRNLPKLNPLFDWTRDAVLSFAVENDVPINPLHAKGFASIGCAPCTRAIAPGQPERAGRWWWEQEDKKECGLHAGRPRNQG